MKRSEQKKEIKYENVEITQRILNGFQKKKEVKEKKSDITYGCMCAYEKGIQHKFVWRLK